MLDNRGMILITAAYGLLWQVGLLQPVWDWAANGWYRPDLVRDTIEQIAVGGQVPWGEVAILLVSLVGLLVLVRVASMIWSGMRLYEFRLSRVGEDMRTEYGLLTRVTATIPLRRVQTLTIREAPLQRLLHRMSVRVETAGGQSTPQQGPKKPREWLAPIVRGSDVPALVREVLPGFHLEMLDWRPLHPRAFARALKPALTIGTVMTLPLFGLFGWRATPRAAVHTGVDDGRGMEAGSAHPVDPDRRCRGLSQRVVVAQRHNCAGREDSDRYMHRVTIRPASDDGGRPGGHRWGERALAPSRHSLPRARNSQSPARAPLGARCADDVPLVGDPTAAGALARRQCCIERDLDTDHRKERDHITLLALQPSEQRSEEHLERPTTTSEMTSAVAAPPSTDFRNPVFTPSRTGWKVPATYVRAGMMCPFGDSRRRFRGAGAEEPPRRRTTD